LIQHEDNGLLAPPARVPELAAALDRLIRDEPLRHRLGERAPQSVLEKGMTADKMVNRYEKLYSEFRDRRNQVFAAGQKDHPA
jgi:glycosyltransferase involved in cell wall biosynthesis